MDDDKDRYWTASTGSVQRSARRALPTTTSQARKGLDRCNWIAKCARQVFGSYRKDDFADPDGYAVQLGMVLERYDDKVIEAVTSPVTGIQRTCKFPPSIAEFIEFIDEHIRRASFAATYDARTARQLEEREEFERLEKAEPLEKRREVTARIMTDLHGRFGTDTKPATNAWKQYTAEELLAKYPPKGQ